MKNIYKTIFGLFAAIIFIGLSFAANNFYGEREANKSEVFRLQTYLNDESESYVRCYNSVNRSSVLISKVKLSYLEFDQTEAERNELDEIESSFILLLQEECDELIAEFESNYNNLAAIDEQISKEYRPTTLRFVSGNPFETLTFTESDLIEYFEVKLAE